MEDDELTPEQLKIRRERKKAFAILSKPIINKRGYELSVNVAKAEDIPKLSVNSVDSYISIFLENK